MGREDERKRSWLNNWVFVECAKVKNKSVIKLCLGEFIVCGERIDLAIEGNMTRVFELSVEQGHARYLLQLDFLESFILGALLCLALQLLCGELGVIFCRQEN